MLKGKRCSLRPLLVEHVTEDYVSWLADPAVNRYLESRFASHSVNTVRAFVKSQNDSGVVLFYGIWASENVHVGNIKLGPIDGNHATSDIGFLIGDQRYWGQGIATEAIALMVEYGFRIGLKKITAGSYENNPASAKALKKVGFLEEGLRPNQVIDGDGRSGIQLFGMSCY